MKKLLLGLLFGFICLSLVSCGGSGGSGSKKKGNPGNNGPYAIRADHPRIFLTAEIVSRLTSITGEPDYAAIRNYVNKHSIDKRNPEKMIMMTGIIALAEPNQISYWEKFKAGIEEVRNVAKDADDDDEFQRNRLSALAIAYDWFHSKYTATERKALADKIIEYLDFLDSKHSFFKNPSFVGGHSRRGNLVGFEAALALYGEDERIKPYFDKIYSNWINGYQYILDTACREGAHYFGWDYGATYTPPGFSLLWYTATGQLRGERYYNEAPYFYAYAIDPYQYPYPIPNRNKMSDLNLAPGILPTFGDCFNVKPGAEAEIIAFSASMLSNSLAEWYYQKYIGNYLWEASRSPRVLALAMKRPPSPQSPEALKLPLARQFSGSGFFIARNTWNDTNPAEYPTIMVFKSTPFYVRNHDHADANTLTINYKGPLFLDAGTYDSKDTNNQDDDYSSPYRYSHYVKTSAHNGLLINNTGQFVPNEELTTINNPARMMDGIKKYSQTDSPYGAWVRGEATGAYASNGLSVKQYLRDVLMAYKPKEYDNSFIFVVDRIKTNTSYPLKVLWQVRLKPKTNSASKYAQISNGFGGYASLDVFGSPDVTLQEVQSPYPGRIDDEGNGIAEWGRLEITAPSTTDAKIASLIVVDDNPLPATSLVKGKYVNNDWVGVIVNKSLLIIAISDNPNISISSEDGLGVEEIYVAGIEGLNCTVKIGNTNKIVTVNGRFGYLSL